jgi:hypothetical protein
MPLRDHSRPPPAAVHAEELLGTWVNTLVRHLNHRGLPTGYRAEPHVRLSAPADAVEAVVLQRDDPSGPAGRTTDADVNVTATPGPQLARTFAAGLWSGDVFEVQVHDHLRGPRLAATVQLVGPANKDRPEHRDTFVREAAGLLHQRVALAIVDVVTTGPADLDAELQQLLGLEEAPVPRPHLYAAAYRPRKVQGRLRPERVAHGLSPGRPLPALPLWLTADLAVPLELEATYEETCRALGIP